MAVGLSSSLALGIMKSLPILFAYLAGIISLLPSLALAVVMASVAWVGVWFLTRIIYILAV